MSRGEMQCLAKRGAKPAKKAWGGGGEPKRYGEKKEEAEILGMEGERGCFDGFDSCVGVTGLLVIKGKINFVKERRSRTVPGNWRTLRELRRNN